MGAEHLFGTQRNLLDGPAVSVDGMNTFGLELDGRGKQPRLFESRVVKAPKHPIAAMKGHSICIWLEFIQQVSREGST